MPTLLCGGDEDPEVFFFNTQLMQAVLVEEYAKRARDHLGHRLGADGERSVCE